MVHVLVVPRGLFEVSRVPRQGIFEGHQVAALRAAGLQVGVLSGGVITTRYLGRSFPYLRYETSGIAPIFRAYRRAYLPARWEHPVSAANRSYRKLEPLLNRYIAEYGKPDVVHAHNLMSGGLIARRIWMETGIPYVVTEHSSSFLSASGIAERDIATLRLAASGAKAVVAVGSQLASSLVEVLGGNTSAPIKVIPNVVDQRLLDLAVRGDHPVYTVVGLGNLIPRKNFSLLIRAFAQADLPADARLVIGGEGSEGRRLKALAKSLLVGDRVEFTGSLDRQRVGQILQDADLFAHSADIETFGVVLIEALAVGLPVLATDSFGPRDIVTPDTGTLTPVADLQAFTEGLSMMYTRRGEFEAARLRRNCHERFSSEVFASRMLWIYQEATS